MIIYHSALNINDEFNDLLLEYDLRVNVLRSFYPKPDSERQECINRMFLDSGAFSAFNKGVELDVKKYADYIEKNKEKWDDIAGLDVIFDVEKSMKNQTYLDKRGLDTIPTYHYKNPDQHLEYLLDHYDHIAFGGMKNARMTEGLKYWLDRSWNIIKKRNWKGKVHGFALTSFKLMKRYPWYSVDSTTAPTAARVGELLHPTGRLPISKAITRNNQIHTKLKLESTVDFVTNLMGSDFPIEKLFDSEKDRDEVNGGMFNTEKDKGTTTATKYRTLVNVAYIHKKIAEYDTSFESMKIKNRLL